MTSVILRNLNRKTLILFVFNLLPIWVSVQFSSAAQMWLTLCNPMDCSTRLPCLSPTPRACSNSYPLSQWCHLTISSSVVPFLSYLQSFPESRSFPVSQLFASDGQSIGASASVISPSNEYLGRISFRMDWLDLLAAQRTLKSLLQLHSSKASILRCSALFMVQLSYPYMTTGKKKKKTHIALTRQTFVGKVVSLHFNMLSRFVIAFLPRRSFNFKAAAAICSDFGAQENSLPLFPLFPHLFAMKWWDKMPWSLFFNVEF